MQPFSAFASTRWTFGAESLSRYNGLASYDIQGMGAPGTSSGAAMDEIEKVASQLPPGDAPGTVASFVSGPLAQPLVSVGVPSARLRLSHVARSDLYLFGKVYDVDGAGNATLIHRLVAPIRVPTIALDPWVDVKLLGFAHRFPAGHRIRVDFSATDASSYNNPQPDVITLTTGLGTFFTLPTTKG